MATTNHDTDDGTDGGALTDETGFRRDVLAAIAALDDGPHGLAIKQALEAQYDDVNHARLYPNLDTLAEKGYVEKGVIDRRTNSYDLTERGRAALEADLEWRAGCLDG